MRELSNSFIREENLCSTQGFDCHTHYLLVVMLWRRAFNISWNENIPTINDVRACTYIQNVPIRINKCGRSMLISCLRYRMFNMKITNIYKSKMRRSLIHNGICDFTMNFFSKKEKKELNMKENPAWFHCYENDKSITKNRLGCFNASLKCTCELVCCSFVLFL